MRHILTVLFAVLWASMFPACSNSSSPPELETVDPSEGTILGGTAVTLTGAHFADPMEVEIDGQPAASVVVVDSETATCVTPAGTTSGAKDVTVTTDHGMSTLALAFTYFPRPTVTSITDDRGSTTGGLDVTIQGTGFTANSAGANSVLIGGAAATDILTVNDTTITCKTPTGIAGLAAVTVSNANGAGTLANGFLYIAPLLYAADGRGGVSGNLYLIDVSDGSSTTIGPIGFPITGLAFSGDGTLFGCTSANAAVSKLVTIDLATGTGTAVGTLQDAGMVEQGCTDITFIGPRLLGWGQPNKPLNQRALEIDPLTALVTDLGGGSVGGGGNAFEADMGGALRLIRTFTPVRTIFDVDPITGVATSDKAVTPDGMVINSMAFLEGVLYCVDSNNSGDPPNDLATIDVATGALTTIGALPIDVDGIAGTIK